MIRGLKLVAVAVPLVLAGGVLAAIGVALLDDDPLPAAVPVSVPRSASQAPETDDEPLSRSQAGRASRAALRVTRGGTVTELDFSDDPGERYEVEVVKDGRDYDIALDENFEPVPNRRYGD